jgi:hypothetical protein
MPSSTHPSPPAAAPTLDGDLDPARYAHLAPAATTAPPTLADLVQVARQAVGTPDEWRHLVRFDPWNRWRLRLRQRDGHELWLMSWLPGQRTGFHDHGDSLAVIAVASGVLHEHSTDPQGAPQVQAIGPDQARIWGARRVREIVNAGPDPAISVHLYAPAR